MRGGLVDRKFLAGVAIIVVAALLFFAFSSSGTSESSNIVVGYTPFSSLLPLFVAKEKAFFAEEGLNVELRRFDSINLVSDAIARKEIAGGGVAVVGVFQAESKVPGTFVVQSLAATEKNNAYDAIVVSSKLGATSLQDLNGKKVGSAPDIIAKTYSQAVFKKAGVKAELVPIDTKLLVQAFAAGQVDALFAFEPYVTIAVKNASAVVLQQGSIPNQLHSPSYTVALVTGERNVAFNRALRKAIVFMRQNDAETRNILTKYTPTPQELAREIVIPRHYAGGNVDLNALQKDADLFYESNVLQKPFDVKRLAFG